MYKSKQPRSANFIDKLYANDFLVVFPPPKKSVEKNNYTTLPN